jgi:lipid-A-disaccharide synthase
MKYYIIAGEASGDLHGANLMKEIKLKDPKAEFRFWGGDLMKEQNENLVKHYKDLAFMGFIEVLANIKTISKNLKFCKKDIENYKPDTLILIDYPGFNLRIAEYIKKNIKSIYVTYYVSPQIWAWKQSRVHKIKRCVDKMLTILPFEKDFYKKFNVEVDYVGHPLLDAIKNYQTKKNDEVDFYKKNNLDTNKRIIALLPGSRTQEIKKMLPIMTSVIDQFKNHQFIIAGAPSKDKSFYLPYLNNHIKLIHNQTYELLNNSTAALVTSGTATLETALFKVPEVVCYKGSKTSYLIARKLIKVKYISLVNLIQNKKVVTELIQADLNRDNLIQELNLILPNGKNHETLISEYKILENKLGGGGASKKAAELIVKSIS